MKTKGSNRKINDFDSEINAVEAQLLKNIEALQGQSNHFDAPKENLFYADQIADTTLLFGGLSNAHEEVIISHFHAFGYSMMRLPEADFDSLTLGKEFCNKGQCNPTYYTIGNLIKFLLEKAKETSVEEVEKKYAFFTAGSCGPCRFGMYENEYRKALEDAGFSNFRFVVYQQSSGLEDELGNTRALGMVFTRDLFVGLVKAIIVADLINGFASKVEPFEVIKGATKKAKTKAIEVIQETFRDKKKMYKGLQEVRKIFAGVKCDYTQVKPIVKVTGEFWASITESHGNYHLFNWLVEENTEVKKEPMGGYLEHLLHTHEIKAQERRGIVQEETGLGKGVNPYKYELSLIGFRKLLNLYYNVYRSALGFKPNKITDNTELSKLADDYYNKRQDGGEAYMEVGHLIHLNKEKLAHMLISIKPFGCMPSSASDGVQSKVSADYTNVLFVSLETSGDSEVNFKSRAQMKIYEAKSKAKAELEAAVLKYNIDLSKVKAFVNDHPQYTSGDYLIKGDYTSTGVNFIVDMHKRMKHPIGMVKHQVSKLVK